jgi:predicted nucleic acid-binding protein
MRLYLDSCCLNRPFDDIAQRAVREEVNAIECIMARIRSGIDLLIGSDALAHEIGRNPDELRRDAALEYLAEALEWVPLGEPVLARALDLRGQGFGEWDALHLASAMIARADVLLTVDYRLYRKARCLLPPDPVVVELPTVWLQQSEKE